MNRRFVSLAAVLGLWGCGEEILPAGVFDAGPRPMSDAFVVDSSSEVPDGTSHVIIGDAGGGCTGDAPLCYEVVDEVLCTTLSVAATCQESTWACPTGYAPLEDCPQRHAECPAPEDASFEMHGDSCGVPVEHECAYAGGSGVPCIGNLYTCACDDDVWSCVCFD